MRTITEYTNNNELISAWDNNELISTIELGGLGPGYEQIIHIGIFESIRVFNNDAGLTLELQDSAEDTAEPGEYREVLDKALSKAMETNPKLKEISGAQAGAILQTVGKFVLQGYNKTMEVANEQLEDDRFIMVQKEFP